MRGFALRLDETFLAAPHKVAAPNRKYGFSVRLDKNSGEPIRSKRGPSHTRPWAAGYGVLPTAEIANLCVERHAQLAAEEPALAARFRALILEAAAAYLEVDLEGDDPDAPHKPQALAAAIDLLLSAWRMSGEKRHLDRAGHFGRAAMAMFLGDGLPLPRASQRHDHYEALTGGPELMLSLFRLHEAEAP
jgi:hypothetical protein